MHRSRRRLLALSAVAALAVTAGVTAVPGSARRVSLPPGPWCGGPLWRLMTLSDRDREKVVLTPTDTNIAAIADMRPPAHVTARRTSRFELRAWRMELVVDRYRIGSDGEIALILFDIPTGRYMNAYLANPHCLSPSSRARAGIVAARADFRGHCPRPTPSWQLLGASVRITGVGFWNPLHGTRGALPTGAELRPVTGLEIVSGCGVP